MHEKQSSQCISQPYSRSYTNKKHSELKQQEEQSVFEDPFEIGM